jgi:hypothetical protein
MQFTKARTYSPKIIAWDDPKLREIEIEPMNEKGDKNTAQHRNKITRRSDESRRTTGGFGPPFPTQNPVQKLS